MKASTLNHPHVPTSPFSAIGADLTRLDMEHRIRRDTAGLESMGDHILRDIGLNRGDIRDALRQGRDWLIRCK